MLTRIRNYALLAIALGAFYFLLSHHFIFTNFKRRPSLLKKNELSLKYTFFSLKQVTPDTVLRIEMLRDAGIENILLEQGLVSEERLDKILEKIDSQ